MPALSALLPRHASNDYRGRPVALYAFCVIALMIAGRSLVHLLKDDSGVHSIATILAFPGDPDPDRVIHLYSALWGGQQLVMVLVYAVVLLRYRNLVPLMYALLIVELGLRMLAGALHPLGPEYYMRPPPGGRMNLPMTGLCALLLWLSLPRGEPQDVTEAGSPRARSV